MNLATEANVRWTLKTQRLFALQNDPIFGVNWLPCIGGKNVKNPGNYQKQGASHHFPAPPKVFS